jgi:hypothetical protein
MDKLEFQKRIFAYYTAQKYHFANIEGIHRDDNWAKGVAAVKGLCDYFGYKAAVIA